MHFDSLQYWLSNSMTLNAKIGGFMDFSRRFRAVTQVYHHKVAPRRNYRYAIR